MKARIFKLGIAENQDSMLFNRILSKTFLPIMGENAVVEEYASIKDATDVIGKAFADSQVVIFAVEKDVYIQTKQTVMKAFGLNPVTNEIVHERLSEARFQYAEVSDDEKMISLHSQLPQNCKAFVTDTGMYSGFASSKGKQTVVFLPVLLYETAKLLYANVIPYINSLYGLQLETRYAEYIRVPVLEKSVLESDVQIGVGHTPATALFTEYISVSDALTERIKVAPISDERKDLEPHVYVVNQSIAAAEFLGVPYGVAISNAYYVGTSADAEKTVFMAVTNAEETVVRKVKSLPGENITDFMLRSMGELCLFLREVIECDSGRIVKPPVRAKINNYKIVLLIVAAIIALTAFFGVRYFKVNNYSFDMWLNNRLSAFDSQKTDASKQTTVSSAEDTRSQSDTTDELQNQASTSAEETQS